MLEAVCHSASASCGASNRANSPTNNIMMNKLRIQPTSTSVHACYGSQTKWNHDSHCLLLYGLETEEKRLTRGAQHPWMEMTTVWTEFVLCISGLPAVNPPWNIKTGLKSARFVLECLWHAKFEVYAAQVRCVATLIRQVSSTLEEGGSEFSQNVATPCPCDRALHYRRPRGRLQR